MLKISFTDFWDGFNENNNLFTNILKEIFCSNIQITIPRKADICFVSVCGSKHQRIINKFGNKCFLFLGENLRPNIYNTYLSLSGDFNSYQGRNFRLPLWYMEIDWYDSNLGTIKVNDIEEKLMSYGRFTSDDLAKRKDCITIFNNKEGTRMDMYHRLKKIMNVDAYGKPFNNWFPTYADYKEKLKKMGNYKFNFCPENSLYPGYYTEKCFHSKLSGCIPIYFADSHFTNDFRKEAVINMYDYLNLDDLENFLNEINNDCYYLANLANEPLLSKMPNLDSVKNFLYKSINTIIK